MAITFTPTKSEDLIRAIDPHVTGGELVALAAHRDPMVKAAVAGREDCPLASMLSLAHETDARILEALIANPSVPHRVLVQLSGHKKSRIRGMAGNKLATTAPA